MEQHRGKTVEFDMCGQICPSTLLIALREINRHMDALKNAEVRLLFKTDNRDCTTTIPAAAANMGLTAEVAKSERVYMIMVMK